SNTRPRLNYDIRHINVVVKLADGLAIVTGPTQLEGDRGKASDLRAGAAMIIARLMSDCITEMTGLEHIQRGYEDITGKLTSLGAKIWLEDMTDEEIEQFQHS